MDEERQVIVLPEAVSIGNQILPDLQITVTLRIAHSSPERTIRLVDKNIDSQQ